MMNVKRAATVVIVGGAFAAWLSAAMAPSGRGPAPPAATTSAPVDLRGAALAGEIARLHERLRPDATPRQPGRNLFRFHAPAARPEPESTKVVPVETAASPAPSQPPLKLVGIAEEAGADGPIRTAIISAAGQLLFVKEGDGVTTEYRVERISEDVVELADLGDGSTRRLALK